MMAKKAAARYQSAQEVAEALAAWLIAHNHKVDPGGSGSSVRSASPKHEPAPARDSGIQQIRRVEKGPATRRSSGSGSDILPGRSVPIAKPIVEPAAIPVTQGDTLASSDPAAMTGSGSRARRLFPTASDPELNAVRLPVARPLDEGQQKEQEAKKESGVHKREAVSRAEPTQDAANFADYLITAPVQTAARLGAATPATPEDLDLDAYRNRAKGPPKWLWYVLFGGFGLAILLLILVLIFSL
jgi:hypothetical protein